MIKVSRILRASIPPWGWLLPNGKILGPPGGHSEIAMRYINNQEHIEDGYYMNLYDDGWIRFNRGGTTFQISTTLATLNTANLHKIQSYLLTNNYDGSYVEIDIDMWNDGSELASESIKVTLEDFLCANKFQDLRNANMLVGV